MKVTNADFLFPLSIIAGGAEKSRERYLELHELEKVFTVLKQHQIQFTRDNYLAFALLLTLGVRKNELIAARWDEFNFQQQFWLLPAERTKTSTAICIPLPSVVVDWLMELKVRACGSDYLFPSRRSSKRREYISSDTLNHALAKMFGQKVDSNKQPRTRESLYRVQNQVKTIDDNKPKIEILKIRMIRIKKR
jgi:integrase